MTRSFCSAIILIAALSSLALTPKEALAEAHQVSGGQLAGAFITGIGTTLTLVAIASTPWENTDASDWHTGFYWGIGATALVVGAIVWGIATRRQRRRRAGSDEEQVRGSRNSIEAATASTLARDVASVMSPELRLSIRECLEPLVGRFDRLMVHLEVSPRGIAEVAGSTPAVSGVVMRCLNTAFAHLALPPSGYHRTGRLSLNISEPEAPRQEVEQPAAPSSNTDVSQEAPTEPDVNESQERVTPPSDNDVADVNESQERVTPPSDVDGPQEK